MRIFYACDVFKEPFARPPARARSHGGLEAHWARLRPSIYPPDPLPDSRAALHALHHSADVGALLVRKQTRCPPSSGISRTSMAQSRSIESLCRVFLRVGMRVGSSGPIGEE